MGDEEGENRGEGRRKKSLFLFSWSFIAEQTVQRGQELVTGGLLLPSERVWGGGRNRVSASSRLLQAGWGTEEDPPSPSKG